MIIKDLPYSRNRQLHVSKDNSRLKAHLVYKIRNMAIDVKPHDNICDTLANFRLKLCHVRHSNIFQYCF